MQISYLVPNGVKLVALWSIVIVGDTRFEAAHRLSSSWALSYLAIARWGRPLIAVNLLTSFTQPSWMPTLFCYLSLYSPCGSRLFSCTMSESTLPAFYRHPRLEYRLPHLVVCCPWLGLKLLKVEFDAMCLVWCVVRFLTVWNIFVLFLNVGILHQISC